MLGVGCTEHEPQIPIEVRREGIRTNDIRTKDAAAEHAESLEHVTLTSLENKADVAGTSGLS